MFRWVFMCVRLRAKLWYFWDLKIIKRKLWTNLPTLSLFQTKRAFLEWLIMCKKHMYKISFQWHNWVILIRSRNSLQLHFSFRFPCFVALLYYISLILFHYILYFISHYAVIVLLYCFLSYRGSVILEPCSMLRM